MTRRISLGLAALALFAVSAARADAPGDAWAAAKGNLPANPLIVVGVNFNTVKSSALFRELWPQLLQQNGGAKKLDEFKADCGIDPFAVLQGLVVVGDETSGVAFLSAKGLDKAKVDSCLGKLAAKDKKKLTVGTAEKGITTYETENDKLAIAYLPKGVLAVSDTSAHLISFLGGKGAPATGQLAKSLGAVNTGAALWFVANQEQAVEPVNGVTMKGAYGHADITAGNIAADIRVATKTAAQATQLAGFANEQLDAAKKAGSMPPAVLKSLKVAKNGEEVQIKAQLAEKDALALFRMAMGGGEAPAAEPEKK